MSLFLYPKQKHVRKLKPRLFKNYRTYKRYLQTEFFRVCVYCRQPDSSAPNLNFGADHYRPKSVPRFASLVCSYSNLYYCCGSCNSRKTAYWPFDEKAGPYIVNPCEHEMASHLRFDASSGRVEWRSPHGKHTEELLQLNDPLSIQYRLNTTIIVKALQKEIDEQKAEMVEVENLYKEGKITLVDYEAERKIIEHEILGFTKTMQSQTGDLPLPKIKGQKLGLNLTSP